MDWNKAKNLILLLLVLMNLFLLCNLGVLTIRQTVAARRTVEELSAYLQENDIALDPDVVPTKNPGRTVMVLTRDITAETSMTAGFLDQKNLAFVSTGAYRNENGTISLYSGGYFAGKLTGDVDSAALVERCEALGVRQAHSNVAGDSYEMQIHYAEYPVFNCLVTAQLEEDVWVLEGRVCNGRALQTDSGEERDLVGLLVGITPRLIQDETRYINRITTGWVAGTIADVGVRLTPVYEISADSGVYYINAIDGTLMSVE